MSSASTFASDGPRAPRAAAPGATRWFYSAAAALLLVLMFVGFQRFYVQGRAYPDRDLTPPIRTLLILHGVAMTAWMLLLLVQSLLVANKKLRVHMSLGMAGAALAAAIVFLGWKLGIASTSVSPPELRIWGVSPRQFMIVPIVSVTIFGAFVAVGVLYRKRPHVHKPMMLLASLAAMPAAVSRIDSLNAYYLGTFWETHFGAFFMTLVLGGALLLVRCATTRKLDVPFAAGWAALVVSSAAIVHMATSDVWDRFAGFLLG